MLSPGTLMRRRFVLSVALIACCLLALGFLAIATLPETVGYLVFYACVALAFWVGLLPALSE